VIWDLAHAVSDKLLRVIASMMMMIEGWKPNPSLLAAPVRVQLTLFNQRPGAPDLLRRAWLRKP